MAMLKQAFSANAPSLVRWIRRSTVVATPVKMEEWGLETEGLEAWRSANRMLVRCKNDPLHTNLLEVIQS